jgi:hypothetical protein
MIRWMRDKLGAHLDDALTITAIHQHLSLVAAVSERRHLAWTLRNLLVRWSNQP